MTHENFVGFQFFLRRNRAIAGQRCRVVAAAADDGNHFSRMNIKNYTSGIAAETSIARIEAKLAAVGATGVMKLYGPDKRVSALIFQMPDGARHRAIRVPANVENCYQALWKDYCLRVSRPRQETKSTIRDQASRTAWKLVQDWIEVQVSMITMQQAEPLEVFLPYVWDGRQTYFEALKGGGFKALPEHV